MRVPAVLLVVLAATGCADGEGDSGDGGDASSAELDGGLTDVASDTFHPTWPLAAAAARPATLTTCPGAPPAVGSTTCPPFSPLTPCAPHELLIPGDSRCDPAGASCPAGSYPVGLPIEATVVHVSGGAGPGGDGSSSRPYGRIGDALSTLTAPAIVAIAKGTYPEAVTLPDGVTLWGACAGATTIAPPGGIGLVVVGRGSGARNLTVRAASGVAVLAGASLEADGLVLEGASVFSLRVHGRASLNEVKVGSTVVGEGTGISAEGGGQITGTRLEVAGAAYAGVRAVGAGSRAEVSAVHVHGTVPWNLVSPVAVAAFQALDGGVIVVRRAVSSGDTTSGARAVGAGSRLELEDVVIQDVTYATGVEEAWGIAIRAGATLSARRVRVERTPGIAVLIAGAGVVQLVDVALNDVRTAVPFEVGIGVRVDASPLQVSGLTIADVAGVGLQAVNGAQLEGSDLVLRGPMADAGIGLWMDPGTRTTLAGVHIERAGGYAVLASGRGASTVASLADLTIQDTQPFSTGQPGGGVFVVDGAQVTLLRARLVGSLGFAVATGWAGQLDARELEIHGVSPTTGFPRLGATGIGAYYGGVTRVASFRVGGSALCGVQVGDASQVELADGIVEDNPVGLNVQVAGYPLGLLTQRVLFRGNGINLDQSSLPVPVPPALP